MSLPTVMTTAQMVLVDVDGQGRTGWTRTDVTTAGHFVGVAAAEAIAAAEDGATANLGKLGEQESSDSNPVGALAAIVSASAGRQWTLAAAPAALIQAFRV